MAAYGGIRRAFAVGVAVAVWAAAVPAAANSPSKAQPGAKMKPAVAYTPLSFAEVPGWEQDAAAKLDAYLDSQSARQSRASSPLKTGAPERFPSG